jgi:hypothetical protein
MLTRATVVAAALSLIALTACGNQESAGETLAREACTQMAKAFELQSHAGYDKNPEYIAANETFRAKFKLAVTQGADARFGEGLPQKAETCNSLYGIEVNSDIPAADGPAQANSTPAITTTAAAPPTTPPGSQNSQQQIDAVIDHYIAGQRLSEGKDARAGEDYVATGLRAATEFAAASAALTKGIPGIPKAVTASAGSLFAQNAAAQRATACAGESTGACSKVPDAVAPETSLLSNALFALIPYGSRSVDDVLARMQA